MAITCLMWFIDLGVTQFNNEILKLFMAFLWCIFITFNDRNCAKMFD